MQETNKTTALDIIKNPISFFTLRVSNIDETLKNAVTKATMDIFLGRFNSVFGDNPTSAAVFRDILKIPTAIHLNGTELGKTGIYHDEGGIYSAEAKATCKGIILAIYVLTPNSKTYINFELVARGGNYVCEIPSRFLNIISREKQLLERNSIDLKAESFSNFALKNAKLSYIAEAAGEAIAKTTVSDQVGEVMKKIGYMNYAREMATYSENLLAIYMGGNGKFPFESKDDIYTKGFKTSAMFDFNLYDSRILTTFATALLIDWSSKIVVEIANSFIFTSSTRGIQDLAGIVIRDISESELYKTCEEYVFLGVNETADEL